MTCNITCVGIQVIICGNENKCVLGPIRAISIILSAFSAFISLLWLLAADDECCTISRFQFIFLVIGSIAMIVAALYAIDPGELHSMEEYNLIETLLISTSSVYFVILCGLICYNWHSRIRSIQKYNARQRWVRDNTKQDSNRGRPRQSSTQTKTFEFKNSAQIIP